MTGNQYSSPKAALMADLAAARQELRNGHVEDARQWLNWWRVGYMNTPASTRRRWKCGR